MVEEIPGVFSAHQLMLDEGGVRRACTLFFTGKRLVVSVPEGIDTRTFILTVIALGVGFTGFLLRDYLLFFAGLMAGIIISLLLGLIDFVVRRRKTSKVKRLAPDDILKFGKRNFEITYPDIIKVKHIEFERYEGGSRFFLPTFRELIHEIEVDTSKGKYVFILNKNDVDRCIELLNEFVSEKIEKENESEEF
jgi:hypothetical protein